MRFRLIPKSSTLDDLELLEVQIFSEFCATSNVWAATTAKRRISETVQDWTNVSIND